MGGYWSRDGREFYLGGHDWANLRTGLWVYDVDKKSTLKVLSGPVFSGQRTRDGRRLLLRLHSPYYELWAVDLDPALSTIEALGPGRTLEEHYQEMANLYTRAIEVDPADASAYSSRAQCYDYLRDQAKANADMQRWSAAAGGRLPLGVDMPPARAGFTFGQPVNLDVAMRFFPTCNCFVNCFSSDGLEMFVDSDHAGGQGRFDLWVLTRASRGTTGVLPRILDLLSTVHPWISAHPSPATVWSSISTPTGPEGTATVISM